MTNAAAEDHRISHESDPGEGGQASLSSLQWVGVRGGSVELHCGNEATAGAGGGGGTSPPVPVSTGNRYRDGLHDQLSPKVAQRWMSFGGVQASQILADYWLWEAILNAEKDTKGIVELGTAHGGFSLFLAAQANLREIFFRTYDVVPPARRIPGFVQCDIYAMATEIGVHLQRHDPIVLFCDGGNKPRELKTFSAYLTPKSMIVVHDWGTEMLKSDIPGNVVEVYGELCDELGSMSRCFRVRDE